MVDSPVQDSRTGGARGGPSPDGMVRVARFADITEAQVVVGALRSAGMHVFLQNEHTGQVDFLWQQALGGFGVLVAAGDAKEAAAFIRQHRGPLTPTRPMGDDDAAEGEEEDHGRNRRDRLARWSVVFLQLGLPLLFVLAGCVASRLAD